MSSRIFAQPDARARYAQSPGVCLPHLQAMLAAPAEPALAGFLVDEQVRRLEEIAEDMRGYVLKREALRRALLGANEEHAWRRALVQLVGERTARTIGGPRASHRNLPLRAMTPRPAHNGTRPHDPAQRRGPSLTWAFPSTISCVLSRYSAQPPSPLDSA